MKFTFLFVIFLISPTLLAHDFSYDNLLTASIKLDPAFDFEAHVDSYMKRYRNDIWKRYHEDEFELEDKRTESLSLWRSQVSSFDLGESFTLVTSFQIKDYDFEKQQFPLDSISPTTYFRESITWNYTLPATIRVFFDNSEIIGDLSMPKDEAKKFLQGRKDRYGNINRDITAVIEFTLQRLKSKNEIIAHIKSVKLYEGDSNSRMIAGF